MPEKLTDSKNKARIKRSQALIGQALSFTL